MTGLLAYGPARAGRKIRIEAPRTASIDLALRDSACAGSVVVPVILSVAAATVLIISRRSGMDPWGGLVALRLNSLVDVRQRHGARAILQRHRSHDADEGGGDRP